jgi:hypothetical protein
MTNIEWESRGSWTSVPQGNDFSMLGLLFPLRSGDERVQA